MLELQLLARALSIINHVDFEGFTFPVPGGPNSNIPLAGSRNPENRSGRRKGYITVSFSEVFASSNPAIIQRLSQEIIPISSQRTSSPRTTISFKIVFAKASSTPFRSFSAFSSLESSCSALTSAEDMDMDIGGTSCGCSGSDKSGAEFERGWLGDGSFNGLAGRCIVAFVRPSCRTGGAAGAGFRRGDVLYSVVG